MKNMKIKMMIKKITGFALAIALGVTAIVPFTSQKAYAEAIPGSIYSDDFRPINCGIDFDTFSKEVDAEEDDILKTLDSIMSSVDRFEINIPGAMKEFDDDVDISKLNKSTQKALNKLINSQNPFNEILGVGTPIVRYIMLYHLYKNDDKRYLNVQRSCAYDDLLYKVAKESGEDLLITSATSIANYIIPNSGTIISTVIEWFKDLFS